MRTEIRQHNVTGNFITATESKYPNIWFTEKSDTLYTLRADGYFYETKGSKQGLIENGLISTEHKYPLTTDECTEEIIIPIGAKYRLEGVAATFTNDGNSVLKLCYFDPPPTFTVVESTPEPSPDWRVPGAWGWNEVEQDIFRINRVDDRFLYLGQYWSYKLRVDLGNIVAGIKGFTSTGSIPATPEQIKKYLVEEAERRGYKLGQLLQNTGIRSHLSKNIIERQYDWSKEFEYYPERDMLSYWGCNIYEKGQWAEIVKEESKPEETYWKCIDSSMYNDNVEQGKIYMGSHRFGETDPSAPVEEIAKLLPLAWKCVTKADYEAQQAESNPELQTLAAMQNMEHEPHFTPEHLDSVIQWMNTWEQLRGTVIPIRFKEDFSKYEERIKYQSNKHMTPITTENCDQLAKEWVGRNYSQDAANLEIITRYLMQRGMNLNGVLGCGEGVESGSILKRTIAFLDTMQQVTEAAKS